MRVLQLTTHNTRARCSFLPPSLSLTFVPRALVLLVLLGAHAPDVDASATAASLSQGTADGAGSTCRGGSDAPTRGGALARSGLEKRGPEARAPGSSLLPLLLLLLRARRPPCASPYFFPLSGLALPAASSLSLSLPSAGAPRTRLGCWLARLLNYRARTACTTTAIDDVINAADAWNLQLPPPLRLRSIRAVSLSPEAQERARLFRPYAGIRRRRCCKV